MQAARASVDVVRNNIVISAVVLVLILIIIFLLYKPATFMAAKRTESFTAEEKELDTLIKRLKDAQM